MMDCRSSSVSLLLLLLLGCHVAVLNSPAADAAAKTNAPPRFNVSAYNVEGNNLPPTNVLASLFARRTGTDVGISDLVQAAADLQADYRNRGYPAMCVSIAPSRITNGVVTMHVYQGASPQILISGMRYQYSSNAEEVVVSPPPPPESSSKLAGATNAPAPAVTTNTEPHFTVSTYSISGNTLLPKEVFRDVFWKYTGTNVTFTDITKAVKELQLEYHNRGYDTVGVTIPQQRLTNGYFRIKIFEGHLADIVVLGNRYYSSNNIMRALPSLKSNMILNSKILQPELDRANANQDRQIYPEIRPGPDPNTTELVLKVKDRLPLHAKLDANNQSSPGTPENRLNFSAVYNNLWQADHSIGVQYSFSPEDFKDGKQWDFYDRPLVANYSAFYRLPLGVPDSIAESIAAHPGNFGYSEANRKFQLPPATGTPELNVYASRSTIDTGVQTGAPVRIFTSINGTIDQLDQHQDLTINEGLGFRLSKPFAELWGIRSIVQGGLDFSSFKISSFATNDFIFTQFLLDTSGNPFTRVSVTPSPVPPSMQSIEYLPLTVRWDGNETDSQGSTDFGISYSPNLWFSNGRNNVQNVAGSSRASGYWHIIRSYVAREQAIYAGWRLAVRVDGQWASEPLISNEQFGVGGVAGVRGYREGEVFGDTGWRIISELKTPPHIIGNVGHGGPRPLTVRGSIFMDYANTFLLDPQSRPANTPLWGTGVGAAASLNRNWEARLLFAWPLLRTPTTEAGQLRISFDLSAQF